jgi:LPS export ABC transporter protein LptC
MQRIRLILIPGLVAILIFFSIELFDRVTDEHAPDETVSTIDYEGYSEGINSIRFDAQGKVDYTLQAIRQISYKNAVTELEEPLIQLYKDGDSHWKITANTGKISASADGSNKFDQIDLIGEVEVYQLDEFGNRTVLSTDFLSVDPTQEILNTDSPVNMYSGNHEQSAIGMQVNLTNDEYIFHRQVRGRYAAQSN